MQTRRRVARRAAAALLAGMSLFAAFSAAAQEQPNPLGALAPWLEQKLGVGGAEPPNSAKPPDGTIPTEPDALPPEPTSATAPAAQVNPFELLRPWLERRLGVGQQESGPATAKVAPAAAQFGPPMPEVLTSQAGLEVGEPGAAPPGSNEPKATGAIDPAATGTAASPIELPQPLRLGVLAGRNVLATLAAIRPVEEGLGRALGRPVEIVPMASYPAMLDAQAERRIDGGFHSTLSFAAAEAFCGCLEPLVAPASLDGSHAYHAIIVARRDSGLASVDDLKGSVVAVGDADSVGARRMQIAGLAGDGLDVPALLAGARDAGSAEEALRLAAAGEVDAAFAWSSLAGDVATGYSRGTLTAMAKRGEIRMDDFVVLWRSPAIAHGPLAVLRFLPDEEKRRIESFFLTLDEREPASYDHLNPYYEGGYVAVDPEEYEPLKPLASEDIAVVNIPPAGAAPSLRESLDSTAPLR